MTLPSVALAWQATGFSVIPILPDGTKRPAVRWAPFIQQAADAGQVHDWWQSNVDHGIALIMGAVSGGAEMLELEGRACDQESLSAIEQACTEAGIVDLWHTLCRDGYSEASPSGGLHLIYRITDHEVPGNEKVARRPATDQELEHDPQDKIKVLAETRGERGYVIVAPTSGRCHPSGTPWTNLAGGPGDVGGITWEERCLLHECIRRVLDRTQRDLPAPVQQRAALVGVDQLASGSGTRPGDDFDSVDWGDPLLLGGSGWTPSHRVGKTIYWTRPGKDPRDGFSATTGRDPARDRLYVFSTSTTFPVEEPLTKFHVYALLHHGGDHAAAAKELRKMGFGSASPQAPGLRDFSPPGLIDPESCEEFTLDALGAIKRLASYVAGDFIYVHEEKQYYMWSGRRWRPDHNSELAQRWEALTSDLLDCEQDNVRKWATTKARAPQFTSWVVSNLRTVRDMTTSRSRFDRDRGVVNLRNGTLDLRTMQFRVHDRDDRITRIFNACYDQTADCPQWTKFMDEVLPDRAVREYVQRACGMSLLGDADQRALFLAYGPTGTGKSQFLETLKYIFGEYGMSASIGAFVPSRDGKGPSPEVHRMRGKRFVCTSETADSMKFDEETVKRLTGRDTMSTRNLYQAEQEWVPECAIWIATNYKPRFASDDDAIWSRSKLIPFLTQFGVAGRPMILDFARKFLFDEADGIFNWMLEGLVDYLRHGLQEPDEIKAQVAEHRREVDTVAMFLEDTIEEGRLAMEPEASISFAQLYKLYMDWCQKTYERPLGVRKFSPRVERIHPSIQKSHSMGSRTFKGLRYAGFWTPADWDQKPISN